MFGAYSDAVDQAMSRGRGLDNGDLPKHCSFLKSPDRRRRNWLVRVGITAKAPAVLSWAVREHRSGQLGWSSR
jgi:hypothetical protein